MDDQSPRSDLDRRQRHPPLGFVWQISAGNILSTMTILATAVLFFANIESRLTTAENRLGDLNRLLDFRVSELTQRLGRETEIQSVTINRVQVQVERIEGKIDRMADRGAAGGGGR